MLHTCGGGPQNRQDCLFLTLAVVRSGWPPQDDLRLSIFTPCTAGDYNGAPFFPHLATGSQPSLQVMRYLRSANVLMTLHW